MWPEVGRYSSLNGAFAFLADDDPNGVLAPDVYVELEDREPSREMPAALAREVEGYRTPYAVMAEVDRRTGSDPLERQRQVIDHSAVTFTSRCLRVPVDQVELRYRERFFGPPSTEPYHVPAYFIGILVKDLRLIFEQRAVRVHESLETYRESLYLEQLCPNPECSILLTSRGIKSPEDLAEALEDDFQKGAAEHTCRTLPEPSNS